MEVFKVTSEGIGFKELLDYPLIKSLFGRRSRRFGLGMEIAEGPLAYRSTSDPLPLSKQERSLLIAAGTGITGWSFGIPYDPANPDTHADISVRYTGRTGPTAAGIGAPILFYTDDSGTYLTNTRDVNPAQLSDLNDMEELTDQIISLCKENTTKLSDSRLDIPSKPGHVLDPNLWWANKPGSTLFMPVNDTSEEMLGLVCVFVKNGYLIVDTETGSLAGDLLA
jgi:hypothetical protein